MTAGCGRRCRVMAPVLAGLAGAAFGAGLLISGMAAPARVIGFLDVTRAWDPSLVLVLVAAVGVYTIATRWIRAHRREPWVDTTFHLPTRTAIDRPLVLGAAIFGVGWGLVGLCPGPAIVGAASGNLTTAAFVAAMAIGMRLAPRAR